MFIRLHLYICIIHLSYPSVSHILHFFEIFCHILYLLFFLVKTGVEKLSGVTFGLGGSGVLGVSCVIDTADTFLIASGKSSGNVCCDDAAVDRFSDIVLSIFLPASLVCK